MVAMQLLGWLHGNWLTRVGLYTSFFMGGLSRDYRKKGRVHDMIYVPWNV